jgi:hypothetical protein
MRPRSVLLTAVATAALSAVPFAAQAHAPVTVQLDRAMYDATVDQTPATLHIAGATRGELGGYLDATVTAQDGTLPAGSNVCERGWIDAVLTMSPGETLTMHRHGDICTGFAGDSTTMSVGIKSKHVEYQGANYDKAKIVGEGLLSFGNVSWFGGQAAFSGTVKFH